jgi:hypothetical protein
VSWETSGIIGIGIGSWVEDIRRLQDERTPHCGIASAKLLAHDWAWIAVIKVVRSMRNFILKECG